MHQIFWLVNTIQKWILLLIIIAILFNSVLFKIEA